MNKILSISLIIWILIDRFKGAWSEYKYGHYITTAVALVLSLLAVFCYHLDMMVELGLAEELTALGEVLTALALTGGSSCIAEIIKGCQGLSSIVKKEEE